MCSATWPRAPPEDTHHHGGGRPAKDKGAAREAPHLGARAHEVTLEGVEDARLFAVVLALHGQHCPGRKPPFWDVKRPARPYKSGYNADSLWETLRAHDQSGRAQTDVVDSGLEVAVLGVDHEPHALLDERAAPSFFLARFPFIKLWFPSL